MDRERMIQAYLNNQLTADDVERGTGLSERSQRELIKIGVLQAVPQARTKQRLLNAAMFRRAAIIACFHHCGLSLTVSGQIAHAAPIAEHIIESIFTFSVWAISGESSPDEADTEQPWKIIIVNNKYVILDYGNGESLEFGELSDGMTKFTALLWRTSNGEHEKGRKIEENFPEYASIHAEDADIKGAVEKSKNPTTTITVNINMAIIDAMKRLIGISP